MSCFNKTAPTRFHAIHPPTFPYSPYLQLHTAIIKEFNEPKRKKVISWFVMNYVGELSYVFQGRRIVSVHDNWGTPYFETRKFVSGAQPFRLLNLSR